MKNLTRDGSPNVKYAFLKNILNWSDVTQYDDSFPFDSSYSVGEDDYMAPDAFLENLKETLYTPWKPMTVILTILYSVVFVGGCLGNIFVIIVVVRHRHLRTLTNMFLVNLTVGDLMVVLICVPVTYGHYIYKDWIYGEILCKLGNFVPGVSVSVSSLSLLSSSINRHFAIHQPLKAKLIFSKRRVYIILGAIWFISGLLFIPTLVVNSVTSFGVEGIFETRVCEENWPNRLEDKRIYECTIFIVIFLFPVLTMWFAYTRICMTLWRQDSKLYRRDSTVNSGQADRVLKQRRKTVKMLIVVVSMFTCSLFPCYVVNMWLDFNTTHPNSKMVIQYIFPFAALLVHANSATNPIVYCFMSHAFRRALVALIFGRKKLKRHRNTTNSFKSFKSALRVSVNFSINDNSVESVMS